MKIYVKIFQNLNKGGFMKYLVLVMMAVSFVFGSVDIGNSSGRITFDYWHGGYDVSVNGNDKCRLIVNLKDGTYDMFTSGCNNYVNGYYRPSLNKLWTVQCGNKSSVRSKSEAMKLFMKCSFSGSY